MQATPTATVVPTSTPVPPFDPSSVISSLGTADFWTALWVTILAGAIGGVVFELLALHGNIELPHKPSDDEFPEKLPHAVSRHVFDLGIVSRIIVGGVAAVAALLVLSPRTGFGLVATALIAGSAGTSILRSLQDRITAALAVGEVNQARENGAKAEAVIDQVRARLEEAQASASAPSGAESIGAARGVPALDDIQSLLGEAKGLARSISKR